MYQTLFILAARLADYWMGSVFESIRANVIGKASIISPAASVLAVLFGLAMLIPIASDVFSDKGGFTGINLSEFGIVVILVAMTHFYSFPLQLIDSIATSLSNGISSSIPAYADYSQATSLKQALEEEDMKNQIHDENYRQKLKEQIISERGGLFSSEENEELKNLRKNNKQIQKGNSNWLLSGFGYESTVAQQQLVYQDPKYENNLKKIRELEYKSEGAIEREVENRISVAEKAIKQGSKIQKYTGWIPDIISWFYSLVLVFMMAMGEILLCLLCLFAPLIMAFAVFKPWREGLRTFFGQYIAISLWKPIGHAIAYVNTLATGSIASYFKTQYAQSALSGLEIPGLTTGIIMVAIINLATIFCLFNIQGIASTIIHIASIDSNNFKADVTGQKVLGAAGGMAGGTAKSIGKSIGIIK